MIEWTVIREGDHWCIGAPVAHVILPGDHPAHELDEQLAEWGMKRTDLTQFDPPEARTDFERVFGPVGAAAQGDLSEPG